MSFLALCWGPCPRFVPETYPIIAYSYNTMNTLIFSALNHFTYINNHFTLLFSFNMPSFSILFLLHLCIHLHRYFCSELVKMMCDCLHSLISHLPRPVRYLVLGVALFMGFLWFNRYIFLVVWLPTFDQHPSATFPSHVLQLSIFHINL